MRHCTLSQGKEPIWQGFCCWPALKVVAALSAVSLQEKCLCAWKKTSSLHGFFSGVLPVDLVLSGAEYLICGGNKGLLWSQKMSSMWAWETYGDMHLTQNALKSEGDFPFISVCLDPNPCVMLRHTLCLVKKHRAVHNSRLLGTKRQSWRSKTTSGCTRVRTTGDSAQRTNCIWETVLSQHV